MPCTRMIVLAKPAYTTDGISFMVKMRIVRIFDYDYEHEHEHERWLKNQK